MGYLSTRQLTNNYSDGYCHLIIPDVSASSGYRSYRFKISDILAASQLRSEKDIANGYAGLDSSGKINPIQLPAIAITNTYIVASQAEMLALSVTVGSVAIRTDQSKSYILQTEPSSVLSNWKELQGVSGVGSFNGRTGTVSPANGDYNADQITETSTNVFVTPELLQKLIDISATPTDTNAFHISTNSEINGLTDIGTIADASIFLAEKTSVWNKVKVTWQLIKSTLKTYFDTLYAAVNHNHAGVYEPLKGADDNYVTDVQLTNIQNLSGTNSGNQVADGDTILGTGSIADPFYINPEYQGGGGGGTDLNAIHTNIAAEISELTGKTTPVDADVYVIEDSETTPTAFGKKKLSWANLKATLKTYFDSLYITTSHLNWTSSGHISGQTSQRIPAFNASGAAELLETESSALTVGNYTVDFPELAEESNWVDNVTNVISGVIGDRAVGVDELGSISESMYTQYGWTRDFINSFITNAALIAALQTTGNWTKVTDVISTYNASQGDRGQTYYANGYFYFCYGTSSHTWLRYGNLDTVLTVDPSYMPTPQIEVGKVNGDAIIIPAKYDIVHITVEAETTTAGNFTLGIGGVQEISQLVVSAACSSNGNAQVTLGGITFNVALTTAQNTSVLVAAALRNATYAGWLTGGTGTTVTFTSDYYKTQTDATYSDNGTGATGTMTTTQQGVNADASAVSSVAIPTSIGTKKRLTYIVNTAYPTSSNRSLFIVIDSAASVKLHLVTQKMFE